MTDYISREALRDALHKADAVTMKGVEIINQFPAADVRPLVRGKWIPDYDYAEYDYDGSTPLPKPKKFQDGWQCGLCGGYMPSETNFCPNCGADMRQGHKKPPDFVYDDPMTDIMMSE